MRKKHSVVIVDDYAILRDGLRDLLNISEDFRVIGATGYGLDAIRCINVKEPDIVVIDPNMPNLEDMSLIKEIARTIPETKIIVFTLHMGEEYVQKALGSGANGYCLKTSSHAELLSALRTVLSGKPYVSPEFSDIIQESTYKKLNRSITN